MKRSVCKGILTAGLAAASVLSASSALAADMFLRLDGIKGESLDSKHKDEINVLSWSWGVSSGTGKTKKGLVPPACIQDLEVTKNIDRATPEIILHGVSGGLIPTARLTVRSGGDAPIEYLILNMTNVTVVSYSTNGDSDTRLAENMVLHFDSMTGEYRPQNPNGTAGTPVPFAVSGGCPQ